MLIGQEQPVLITVIPADPHGSNVSSQPFNTVIVVMQSLIPTDMLCYSYVSMHTLL